MAWAETVLKGDATDEVARRWRYPREVIEKVVDGMDMCEYEGILSV
jgi:hypothetical protein